ncbi:uncharacterized protein LOC127102571 [Lathyrus oleraceus]|uniref:uncharacterized protein LOC127102571 n=1 Tax=Pisum sativum TaxID=3888 RepID=UPI0021D1C0E6|nr:uncharacterized protein LOC127102571 [Pisum sativum]
MGTFPSSFRKNYILVEVDYVSKWVEAATLPTNDSRVVVNFVKNNVFSRFGVPRELINDEGTHFLNKLMENLLKKYNVKHKIATTYHPQTDATVNVAISSAVVRLCESPLYLRFKHYGQCLVQIEGIYAG